MTSLKLRDREGFYLLIECLRHNDPRIRYEVVDALVIPLDKHKSLNALIPLLEDTTLIPNYSFNGVSMRICDQVALRLKRYGIPRAQEICDEI